MWFPGFLGEKAMQTSSMTVVNSAKQDSWRLRRGKGSPPSLARITRGGSVSFALVAFLSLLTAPSCKVPEEESGYVGPSAVETLGIEVDEMGIEVRELRRTKSRLQREIQARKADLARYEEARKEASLAARKAKQQLDKILEDLHFLEQSQAKAIQRSAQVRTWMAELEKFESEKATLEKRKAELPGLIEKARTAVAEQEAELGTLNALLEKAAVEKAPPAAKKSPPEVKKAPSGNATAPQAAKNQGKGPAQGKPPKKRQRPGRGRDRRPGR